MRKISVPISNDFCPQTLYLFGTYKEDGMPNFGLFCWFGYCWDGGLRVMACIGGEKLTKDRIHATKVFSASLVTEAMLPAADYVGNNEGRDVDKSFAIKSVRGEVLNVPIPEGSPKSYELEVERSVPVDDGEAEVFICKIMNVLVDERLADETVPYGERVRLAAPVLTTPENYFSMNPVPIGKWGQWKDCMERS